LAGAATNVDSVDILIVGSGMGGATCAAGLAPSGASVLVLERGARLKDSADARDPRAIFQRGVFRPQERWVDGAGEVFNPGNYYYVGGNTKLYGAVLLRYRARDFRPIAYRDGATPGWPFNYEELEPWYTRAEKLYRVRGALGFDESEPPHSEPFPFAPVPDEPAIARVRERIKGVGLHPFPLPLGLDIDRWLERAKTPWDAFPDTGFGKMDAESCGLAEALRYRNVELRENAKVERLLLGPDGKRLIGVEARIRGERRQVSAKIVILAAGAVNSAALLLASRDHGIDPRTVNDSVYQKTLGINDFYLDDGHGGPPLGNIQLLGRVTAPILKSNLPQIPEWALSPLSRRSVDWYAMSEDLPNPESRVTVRDGAIHLDWKRSNWSAHEGLVRAFKERLKAAGYPIVLTKPFDRRTPSHQCGTVRIGHDPTTSPLDSFCRAYDHPNLLVVDASFLPTSAAVNPSLTIAAQALRVADHIVKNDLR
jgi:choline dehydrogenase-like flavoprotein